MSTYMSEGPELKWKSGLRIIYKSCRYIIGLLDLYVGGTSIRSIIDSVGEGL